VAFSLTAPFAVGCAAVVLLRSGSLALSTGWSSLTLSLTHMATLGFIAMVTIGVAYPMTSWLGAGRVPAPRLAHLVHASLVVGVATLCWGTAWLDSRYVFAAIGALGIMGLAFLIPLGIAVRRASAADGLRRGMAISLSSFFVAASLGLWVAHGHGGMQFPGPRGAWIQVHLCVALLGWVGGLFCALSWRVLPARFGARPVSSRDRTRVEWLLAAGLTLPVVALLLDYFAGLGMQARDLSMLVGATTLPAIYAVWLRHPWLCLRSLAGIEAGNATPTGLYFWRAAMWVAPLVFASALAAFLLSDPRAGVVFGWLAIWGWAGMLVHGLLQQPGPLDRPSAVEAEPALARVSLWLHLSTLVVGLPAIVTGSDTLVRVTALGLLATSISMFAGGVGQLRAKPSVPTS
jgi:hypothetical protein